jgi:hypothetical protein
MIKSRRIRWVEHVTRMWKKNNSYRILEREARMEETTRKTKI